MAKKIKQYATNIDIIVKNTLIEAYNSIGIVEHYHGSLEPVYSIVTIKIPDIKLNLAFQMFFKAINNLVGLNRLISTLLVFGANLRMTKLYTPSLLITQCIIAIKKTIDKVQKYIVFR